MTMNIPGASQELCEKFERLLAMDLDQLNQLYIQKMKAAGIPIVSWNQPDLDTIYRELCPEIFDLAARFKRERGH